MIRLWDYSSLSHRNVEERTKNYRQNSKSNDTNNNNQEFYYHHDAMIETESEGKSGANTLAMEKDKPKYGQSTDLLDFTTFLSLAVYQETLSDD